MPKFNEIEDNRRRRRVAKDGEVVRAPLMLMDGLRAAVANASNALSGMTFDAAGHRPGFVQLTDAQMAAKVAAYDGYIKRLSTAWKNPPPVMPTATPDKAPPTTTTKDAAYANYDKRLSERWKGAAA